MKKYRIQCNKNKPLREWGGVFTEQQIITMFWNYALDEGDFGCADERPEGFNLAHIEEEWDVDFIETQQKRRRHAK